MQLGLYHIPEIRLIPMCVTIIKQICIAANNIHKIDTNELARLMGNSEPSGGAYYRKVASLITYGLIKYENKFYSVTELGENIAFVENNEKRIHLFREAILNVKLWKELNEKFPNGLEDNFALVLKNMTSVDLSTVKKYEKDIIKWYEKDISVLQDNNFVPKIRKEYSFDNDHNNNMKSEIPVNQNIAPNTDRETPIYENTGQLTMKIEEIPMPFTIPFKDEKTLQVVINVLNLFADKFGIDIIATKRTTKNNSSSSDG